MRNQIHSTEISGVIETETEIADTRQRMRVGHGPEKEQIGIEGVTEVAVVQAHPSTVAITIDRLIEMTEDRNHAPEQQKRNSLDEVGLGSDLATEIEAETVADHEDVIVQGKTVSEAKTQSAPANRTLDIRREDQGRNQAPQIQAGYPSLCKVRKLNVQISKCAKSG